MLQMGSKSASADAGKVDLNMTPMIDVVFQLLIFFMVTLQLPQLEGMIETILPTVSPQGEQGPNPPKPSPFSDLLLTLSREPGGAVTRRLNNMSFRTDRQLERHLGTLRNASSEGRVVIVCDGDVPYGHLVRTMSVVQKVGMIVAFGDPT